MVRKTLRNVAIAAVVAMATVLSAWPTILLKNSAIAAGQRG